jgi:hypothetical protein
MTDYSVFFAPPPTDLTPRARRLVNRKFAVALMFAGALFLVALIPLLYHASAAWEGHGSRAVCISALQQMSGATTNNNNTPWSGGANACSHRIEAMEGMISILAVAGGIVAIAAFVYRRRAMRYLDQHPILVPTGSRG